MAMVAARIPLFLTWFSQFLSKPGTLPQSLAESDRHIVPEALNLDAGLYGQRSIANQVRKEKI